MLAALLCHERLLPSIKNNAIHPIRASYLADFDAILKGEDSGNTRMVLEQMMFSFMRVLPTLQKENSEYMMQFFADGLEEPPVLDLLDGVGDYYLVKRIRDKLDHEQAYKKASQKLAKRVEVSGGPSPQPEADDFELLSVQLSVR